MRQHQDHIVTTINWGKCPIRFTITQANHMCVQTEEWVYRGSRTKVSAHLVFKGMVWEMQICHMPSLSRKGEQIVLKGLLEFVNNVTQTPDFKELRRQAHLHTLNNEIIKQELELVDLLTAMKIATDRLNTLNDVYEETSNGIIPNNYAASAV